MISDLDLCNKHKHTHTETNTLYFIMEAPSLNELTPMIFNMGLTHLDSEASIYRILYKNMKQLYLYFIDQIAPFVYSYQ